MNKQMCLSIFSDELKEKPQAEISGADQTHHAVGRVGETRKTVLLQRIARADPEKGNNRGFNDHRSTFLHQKQGKATGSGCPFGR